MLQMLTLCSKKLCTLYATIKLLCVKHKIQAHNCVFKISKEKVWKKNICE